MRSQKNLSLLEVRFSAVLKDNVTLPPPTPLKKAILNDTSFSKVFLALSEVGKCF